MQHWIHNLDPFLIRFWGEVGIRWYGLAYLAGLAVGFWLMCRWAAQGRLPLVRTKERDEVMDLVVAAGIGMLLGGRLGYVLFYDPALITRWDAGFPWWGVLQLNHGGMASHGGIIGLGLGLVVWALKHRKPILVLGDAAGILGTLGICFGRIANFINGELWGRPSEAPWAVIFPDSVRLPPDLIPGTPAWEAVVRALAVPRHPSQLYAAGLEGLFVFLILLPIHLRHRRPGLTLGLFFALYGVGRFVGEFFRAPDAGQPGSPGVEAILGFMTKGQALTIPFIIAGIALAIWALRRPARPELYANR